VANAPEGNGLWLGQTRALVDSGSVRALRGGKNWTETQPIAVRQGSKHHILTKAHGIPLTALLTAANRHDITPTLAAGRRDSATPWLSGSARAQAGAN
jgi:hypothetical protein